MAWYDLSANPKLVHDYYSAPPALTTWICTSCHFITMARPSTYPQTSRRFRIYLTNDGPQVQTPHRLRLHFEAFAPLSLRRGRPMFGACLRLSV